MQRAWIEGDFNFINHEKKSPTIDLYYTDSGDNFFVIKWPSLTISFPSQASVGCLFVCLCGARFLLSSYKTFIFFYFNLTQLDPILLHTYETKFLLTSVIHIAIYKLSSKLWIHTRCDGLIEVLDIEQPFSVFSYKKKNAQYLEQNRWYRSLQKFLSVLCYGRFLNFLIKTNCVGKDVALGVRVQDFLFSLLN